MPGTVLALGVRTPQPRPVLTGDPPGGQIQVAVAAHLGARQGARGCLSAGRGFLSVCCTLGPHTLDFYRLFIQMGKQEYVLVRAQAPIFILKTAPVDLVTRPCPQGT